MGSTLVRVSSPMGIIVDKKKLDEFAKYAARARRARQMKGRTKGYKNRITLRKFD